MSCISFLHAPGASKIRGFLNADQRDPFKSSDALLTNKYRSRSLSPMITRAEMSLSKLSNPRAEDAYEVCQTL